MGYDGVGITLVVVSFRYYGATRAETVLGKALKSMPIPRESYVISTKCGRYGDDNFNFSADRVTRSVDESLARLNLDYLDIILCHDIEFVNLDQVLESALPFSRDHRPSVTSNSVANVIPFFQIVNETIPALQKVKQSGKVRHIGFSGYPLKIFRWVHSLPIIYSGVIFCSWWRIILKKFYFFVQICVGPSS